jgi:site-specific DNA recombinase
VAHRPRKIAAWDILVCAKLDRITRSTRDFDDLLKWCKMHGKTLVSVAESFDLTTPMGGQ